MQLLIPNNYKPEFEVENGKQLPIIWSGNFYHVIGRAEVTRWSDGVHALISLYKPFEHRMLQMKYEERLGVWSNPDWWNLICARVGEKEFRLMGFSVAPPMSKRAEGRNRDREEELRDIQMLEPGPD